MLDALKIFVIGEANRKALFELGVVDGLIELVETWQEDARKPLNPQLAILEAALQVRQKQHDIASRLPSTIARRDFLSRIDPPAECR